FAGADAHSLLDRRDEDLAVADLAGAGGLADGVHGAFDLAVLDHQLDLDLGQEAHGVLGAAIDLGLALLPAEPLDLADRQALDAKPGERVAHLVELEGLEDRHHQFHCRLPFAATARKGRASVKSRAFQALSAPCPCSNLRHWRRLVCPGMFRQLMRSDSIWRS